MDAKYYEIHIPYYAMIKANTPEDAVRVYTESVADHEGTLLDKLQEVTEATAAQLLGRVYANEEKPVTAAALLVEIRSEPCPNVILVDRELL